MDHGGKTVFVPNFPVWLKPENKPVQQRFHEKDSTDWAPGEWGYSNNIHERIATVNENRRVLDEYRARGEEPPPGSTTHLPGMPWRQSDAGFDAEQNERGMLRRKAKVDLVKHYVTTIKTQRDSLSKLLVENRALYSERNQELIVILEKVGEEYERYKRVITMSKESFQTAGLAGKDKREMLDQINRSIHAMKLEMNQGFRQRWTGYMQKIKSAAAAIGTRNFLGNELPVADEKNMFFYFVVMALCGTARQQLMRLLAFDFPADPGPRHDFAMKYGAIEDAMAQLRSMTSPVKLGSKYRRSWTHHYDDSDQLRAWFLAHEPYAFYRASVQ